MSIRVHSWLAFAALFFVSGCAVYHLLPQPVPLAKEIPNFAQVNPGLYRGGQPTLGGWLYLKNTCGVSNVIKLNTEVEASDSEAELLGMAVYRCPIDLAQQLGESQLWQSTILADATIMIHPGSFVHCEHGQDRTGLVVATYRLMHDHWSKADAQREMLAHGFHRFPLLGLWDCWEDMQ